MGQMLFVLGLERCGTHGLSFALKESCLVPCWVKHEDMPFLCKEVADFLEGNDCWEETIRQRTSDYQSKAARADFVCEANHRLSFFVERLATSLPSAKFVLLLRHPSETMISRIANFAHWPEIIERYPECFRNKITQVSVFEKYRPKPVDLECPLHELYLWEWIETYKWLKRQLAVIKPHRILTLRTESLSQDIESVLEFVDPAYFDKVTAARAISLKIDSVHHDPTRADVIEFAKETVLPYEERIMERLSEEFPNDLLIKQITSGE